MLAVLTGVLLTLGGSACLAAENAEAKAAAAELDAKIARNPLRAFEEALAAFAARGEMQSLAVAVRACELYHDAAADMGASQQEIALEKCLTMSSRLADQLVALIDSRFRYDDAGDSADGELKTSALRARDYNAQIMLQKLGQRVIRISMQSLKEYSALIQRQTIPTPTSIQDLQGKVRTER